MVVETERDGIAAAHREALPEEALLVAVAGRTHGVRGALRLFPSSNRPERLEFLTRLWFAREGESEALGFEVTSARRQGRCVVVTLEGVSTREDAAELTNLDVHGLPSELPPWGPDEFGLVEVLGAELYDREERVGTVAGLVEISGRDYLEVERSGRRLLVPAVKDWLLELDLTGGRIVMALPEGLVDG